jgi:hypothetical protein
MMEPDLSLDDVLDIVMLEEQEPSDQALSRWTERFPQFSQELTDYFRTWSIQEERSRTIPAVEVDEDWLVDAGLAYAFQLLRRKEAKLPDDAIEPLNAFERLLLTAMELLRTPRACYVEQITAKVNEVGGREVPRSSVAAALNNLESRYVVYSWSPDPEKFRNEAGRQYFFATPIGERSLEKANEEGN